MLFSFLAVGGVSFECDIMLIWALTQLNAIKVTSGEHHLGSWTLSVAVSSALILIITLDLGQDSIFITAVESIVQKVHQLYKR